MFFDSYDTPVFRPPSEARSFILRVTRAAPITNVLTVICTEACRFRY